MSLTVNFFFPVCFPLHIHGLFPSSTHLSRYIWPVLIHFPSIHPSQITCLHPTFFFLLQLAHFKMSFAPNLD